MKRILLETLCAMAVVVFLASLHGRVSSLKENHAEVTELRALVQKTARTVGSIEDSYTTRVTTLSALERKIAALEAQVAAAAVTEEEADKLRHDIGETRKEAAHFKAQLTEDISRTQETVDAYLQEMRHKHDSGQEFMRETRDEVALLACHLRRDPLTLTEELLAPGVQLNGEDTVGSGTLVYSGPNPKSKQNETYVLTSFHVIRNILADTPSAKRDGIAVTIYHADATPDREDLRCDMVAHEAKIDAALLKLRTTKRFKNVARVVTSEAAGRIQVWDPICAVGCPLGNDPIPSHGEVSSLRNELNGANYWMINAPTYFGNSGGGVYLSDSRELIGVFSKIYTHGRGNPVVIPHMGLFTPMPSIYRWLREAKLEFVLSNATLALRKPSPSIERLAVPAPR